MREKKWSHAGEENRPAAGSVRVRLEGDEGAPGCGAYEGAPEVELVRGAVGPISLAWQSGSQPAWA